MRCNSASYLIIYDDPKEIWKEKKYYLEFNSNNSGNTIRDCDYFIFDSLKSIQNCRVLYDSTVQMKTDPIYYSFTDTSITFPFYGGFWSPMNTETWKIKSKASNSLKLNSIIYYGTDKINRTIYLKKN